MTLPPLPGQPLWARLLGTTTLRGRLRLLVVVLVSLAAGAIVVFLPQHERRQALEATAQRARTVAQMTAFAIGPAVEFGDWQTVEETIAAARQNPDLAYLAVLDGEGMPLAGHRSELHGAPRQHS